MEKNVRVLTLIPTDSGKKNKELKNKKLHSS